MTLRTRGLLLAALHLALIGAMAGKYALDRATQPRVWVKTVGLDPSTPLRGRYVRLNVVFEPRGFSPYDGEFKRDTRLTAWRVNLRVEGGKLVGYKRGNSSSYRGVRPATPTLAIQPTEAVLGEPLAFFLPEHVPDPSVRAPGEELWAEVTIPRGGPPRPIRLGVKRNGKLEPLP